MDIKYFGHSSFLIKSKNTKIITDPFDPKMLGIPLPKQEADIVTVSHHHRDHDNTSIIEGVPRIIDWPGEYEVKGVRIFGYKSFHDNKNGAERGEVVLYKFEMEDMSVLHCGDIGIVPDATLIEEIGNVDIMFLPVGGVYTINSSEAVKLISKIEPSIVIPMHYNHQKLNQENFSQLEPVDNFLKEIMGQIQEVEGKISVKKEELSEELKVIVMKV